MIKIVNTRPSKKNPNAKYRVVSVGKNGETLQQSEALNDEKAVKTHIKAMNKIWSVFSSNPKPLDHTKEQKFAKSGFAIATPAPKKTKKATN